MNVRFWPILEIQTLLLKVTYADFEDTCEALKHSKSKRLMFLARANNKPMR
jgi:hypothetical protein